MKILFIQTNYPDFLSNFYKKNKVSSKNYKEIKKVWAKEYFGSSNFYLKNMKHYGWEGDEIIANDPIMQNAWSRDNGTKIKASTSIILKFIPQRIKNVLNLNHNLKKIVFDQIKFYKPDVIYIHDITYFNPLELRRMKRMVKLLVGQIAYPKPLDMRIFNSYDLLISSLRNFIEDFKNMGVPAEYLAWCMEDKIVKEIKFKKRIYDVTYIGGVSPHHSKGNKVLEYLSKRVDVNFWGYGKNFLPLNSNIRKHFHDDLKFGKDMFDIFSKSKIVINRHINLSKQYANNMRLFEATGMGALLITDKKVNNDEFFDTNKEIVVYSTPEDLVRKVKYYLKNDKQRLKIAKAGQKKTLSKHTYKIRMGQLDKILRRYLKQ